MDWLRQERERGISIVAAATHVNWRGCELQIVDTPGHVDFTAEVERCMRVLDGVVVVLDAVRGVESQTLTVWRQADHWRAARLVFVNKMDRVGADFDGAVHALAQRFSCRPIPVVIPLFDAGGAFAGLGDPVRGTATWCHGEVPEALHDRLRAQLHRAREVVVEAGADFDEAIMAAFVAGADVETPRLLAALRRGCIGGALVPVLAGAALHGQGVDLLLDAICDLLPSPVDRDRTDLADAFPPADPDAPACALVFKVEHDDREVRNYLRVFTGRVAPGDELAVARTGARQPVDELWAMHASHHEPVAQAGPGAIVVLPGARELQTGDTLHAPGRPRRLPMPRFPPPVVAAVFEPATPEGEGPLVRALGELQADDPTLELGRDGETGLPLVFGMGELHLEIVAARARERVDVPFTVSRPRVALRATVRRTAEGRAVVQAPQASGRWAEAAIEVEPLAGDGVTVDVGPLAAGPRRDAVEALLRATLAAGASLPAPAAGMRAAARSVATDRASERDGDTALVDQAVAVALGKALDAAGRVELEPEVEFDVRCPPEHRSVVLADLLARGAAMRQVSAGQLGALLQGRGRLRAFLGYATRLRSLTRGQGEVQLQPRGLAPVDGPTEGPLPPQI